MKQSICLVCHSKCFFYYQNIDTINSKHSKRPIKDMLIDIVGENQLQSNNEHDNSLCYECFDRINVYDLAKSTVESIVRDFKSHFSRGSTDNKNQLSSRPTTIQKTKNLGERNNRMNAPDSPNETDDDSENNDIFTLYEVFMNQFIENFRFTYLQFNETSMNFSLSESIQMYYLRS